MDGSEHDDAWWSREVPRMREGNRLEAKRAKGGLPHSLWETYSSFANTEGGLILLGVSEHEDHSLYITGVDDARNMAQDFWNMVHDPSKVSAVVLSDNDVVIRHTSQGDVISIDIPRAARDCIPVYVGQNPMTGSYRRNGDGDYLCDEETVRAMLRDSDLLPLDRTIVEGMGADALNADSVASYRRQFKNRRPGHPWGGLSDEDFLLRIEALRLDGSQVRPTRAGLLMFGEAWRITSEFPYYFLDYREVMDDQERWNDRFTSDDDTWSGNLYDFWGKVVNRLRSAVAHPFQLDADLHRIDDNPMDKAVREAVTNTLVHADYFIRRGTVIIQYYDRIVLSNPGSLRLSSEEVMQGGISDTRNPTLMKMFNLIGIGEKAGSGFDVMREGCLFAGTAAPELEVFDDPGRVQLTLYPRKIAGDSMIAGASAVPGVSADGGGPVGAESPTMRNSEHGTGTIHRIGARGADRLNDMVGTFGKNVALPADFGNAIRPQSQLEKITYALTVGGPQPTSYLAVVLGLGLTRTREILASLVKDGVIEPIGVGRGRKYRLAEHTGS